MTEIDFYSGSEDKLATACRLVSKVFRRNLKLMIYTREDATVERMDKLLWTFTATGFVPHCLAGDPLADITPVIIGTEALKRPHEVLLNLDAEHPPFFSRFQRLIEIAGSTQTEISLARKRWRFYHGRGYEIRHHKLDL